MFRSSSSPGVNVFFISSNSFFPALPPNNFRASSRSFVVILLKSNTLNCGTLNIYFKIWFLRSLNLHYEWHRAYSSFVLQLAIRLKSNIQAFGIRQVVEYQQNPWFHCWPDSVPKIIPLWKEFEKCITSPRAITAIFCYIFQPSSVTSKSAKQ